jgi:hypothetical protein
LPFYGFQRGHITGKSYYQWIKIVIQGRCLSKITEKRFQHHKIVELAGEDMAETLGSLCDKLTIVKLKQYHTEDLNRLDSLADQEKQLCDEIDTYFCDAIKGKIPKEKMVFSSNKVYKIEGNEFVEITGDIGMVISELAKINCDLWHEQEKIYEFEKVSPEEKNIVIKRLALLNLQRNQCINEIDKKFHLMILNKH